MENRTSWVNLKLLSWFASKIERQTCVDWSIDWLNFKSKIDWEIKLISLSQINFDCDWQLCRRRRRRRECSFVKKKRKKTTIWVKKADEHKRRRTVRWNWNFGKLIGRQVFFIELIDFDFYDLVWKQRKRKRKAKWWMNRWIDGWKRKGQRWTKIWKMKRIKIVKKKKKVREEMKMMMMMVVMRKECL